jgi:hypothetical protein
LSSVAHARHPLDVCRAVGLKDETCLWGADMHGELNKVIAALQELFARESVLFERDLGERALTHRLAVHVERQFPGWDVDCEYDRLGERTLRLPRGSIVSTDDHLAKSVYPDLVVHQRAIPNNLLAIELRKAINHQPVEHDRRKLMALTDPHLWFAYWIGLLLTLGKTTVTASEVYVGGVIDPALTAWFDTRLKEAALLA